MAMASPLFCLLRSDGSKSLGNNDTWPKKLHGAFDGEGGESLGDIHPAKVFFPAGVPLTVQDFNA